MLSVMVRRAGIALLFVVLVGFAGGAGSAPATHLGFRPCKDIKLRRASLTHVQSNFGCRNARRALRTLLAHGIGRLPKPTLRFGRWGCRDTGSGHFYVCERRRADTTQAPASVVFSARARHN
jgi:hypothetical protein